MGGSLYCALNSLRVQVKELTYMHSEGLQAGELKHGPLALVDSTCPIIMIMMRDNVFNKCMNALQQVRMLMKALQQVRVFMNALQQVRMLMKALQQVRMFMNALQQVRLFIGGALAGQDVNDEGASAGQDVHEGASDAGMLFTRCMRLPVWRIQILIELFKTFRM